MIGVSKLGIDDIAREVLYGGLYINEYVLMPSNLQNCMRLRRRDNPVSYPIPRFINLSVQGFLLVSLTPCGALC